MELAESRLSNVYSDITIDTVHGLLFFFDVHKKYVVKCDGFGCNEKAQHMIGGDDVYRTFFTCGSCNIVASRSEDGSTNVLTDYRQAMHYANRVNTNINDRRYLITKMALAKGFSGYITENSIDAFFDFQQYNYEIVYWQ